MVTFEVRKKMLANKQTHTFRIVHVCVCVCVQWQIIDLRGAGWGAMPKGRRRSEEASSRKMEREWARPGTA